MPTFTFCQKQSQAMSEPSNYQTTVASQRPLVHRLMIVPVRTALRISSESTSDATFTLAGSVLPTASFQMPAALQCPCFFFPAWLGQYVESKLYMQTVFLSLDVSGAATKPLYKLPHTRHSHWRRAYTLPNSIRLPATNSRPLYLSLAMKDRLKSQSVRLHVSCGG